MPTVASALDIARELLLSGASVQRLRSDHPRR